MPAIDLQHESSTYNQNIKYLLKFTTFNAFLTLNVILSNKNFHAWFLIPNILKRLVSIGQKVKRMLIPDSNFIKVL
jgi:hypothetical protein